MKKSTAGLVGLILTLGADARGYPIAEERKLGERFSIEAASELPLMREPAVVDYVSGIGRRIVAHLGSPQPFQYRFSIVRDGQLNAFAVPGGFVYVNSGLLTRVGNESELAGVLSHEIGHTHAHHIVRQQEESRLVNYAAIAGMLLSVVQPAIGAAAMGAGAAAQLKYQRQFEQEADYLGIRYMREAGFDPHGMATFMKRIWNDQRTLPLDQIPPYMLSHPMTDERITNLETATKDMPLIPGWDQPTWELQHTQAIVRALTEDRSATRARYEKASSAGGLALALLGVVRLYQGDAAGALETLGKAKAAGVAGLDTDTGLARFRSGDLDGAILTLKGRVEAVPDDAVARGALGEVLLAKGDYAAAKRELELALAASPELDQLEYDLGQSYGRSGDQAHGLLHLARALELRGDVEQALAQYEKAAKLLPAGASEADESKQRVEFLQEIGKHRIIGRRGS